MFARAVGLWLPIEKLGVDAVLLNQVIDTVLTFAAALVALDAQDFELADKVAENDGTFTGHGQSQRSPRRPPVTRAAGRVPSGNMDALTLFGLFAVTAMLVFYALEDRSRSFTLAFAAARAMGSAYGFLQGAWPFGIVEAIWGVVALRRWWAVSRTTRESVSS